MIKGIFGPKRLSPYSKEVEKVMIVTYLNLSEKDRRIYIAVEALKLPRGGRAYIAKLFGCSTNTLLKGINELKDSNIDSKNRIRKSGGGRKSSIDSIDNINEVFLEVIDEYIAGDPMDEKIRWTNLSHKKISLKMKEKGISVSHTVISKLLKKHGFKKRKALKVEAIGSSENRDEQFKNITKLKEQYNQDGNPILSMDTKKKNY